MKTKRCKQEVQPHLGCSDCHPVASSTSCDNKGLALVAQGG